MPFSWVEMHYFLVNNVEVFDRYPECFGKTAVATSLTDESVLGKKIILKNEGESGVSISLGDDDSLGYGILCEFMVNPKCQAQHVFSCQEFNEKVVNVGDLIDLCVKNNNERYEAQKDYYTTKLEEAKAVANMSSLLSELE